LILVRIDQLEAGSRSRESRGGEWPAASGIGKLGGELGRRSGRRKGGHACGKFPALAVASPARGFGSIGSGGVDSYI
jgi:hypothetical protein